MDRNFSIKLALIGFMAMILVFIGLECFIPNLMNIITNKINFFIDSSFSNDM